MTEESAFGAERYPGELASFAPPAAPPPMAAYELRPLTTGEILDRTFYLYRGHFWLFTGISAVAAGAATLASIVQLIYNHFSHPAPVVAPADIFHNTSVIVLAVLAGILYLVVYSVAHAATVSAVTSLYLGDTTSNQQAFRAVRHRWLRYVGIALWQIWSSMWIIVVAFVPIIAGGAVLGLVGGRAVFAGLFAFVAVIVGFVCGIIGYIRNSLAVPVEVTEDLPLRAAMRRSKDLAAGSKGRIFLLFLLVFVLYIVAAGAQAPIGIFIAKAGPSGRVYLLQILSLFVNFIMATLITPVGAIGLCLFYIDQRVRKEGFDIQFLLDRSSPALLPADAVPLAETP